MDGVQPAGSYTVETEDEFLGKEVFLAYRRRATLIHVHAITGTPPATRTVKIDPEELDAALRRDVMLAETHPVRRIVSFSRRRAHRTRKKALIDRKKLESY